MTLQQQKNIGIWCNGNTTDSGPVIPGSNPGIPTNSIFLLERCFFCFREFLWMSHFLPVHQYSVRLSVKVLIHIKKPKCLVCTPAVLFYLFSASIAFIFCFTSSRSSLSFCTFRFISSTRLFPFLLAALRKPRLFS